MAISQFKVQGLGIGAGAISDIDTVKRFPLGYEVTGIRASSGTADSVFGQENAVFKYVQGSNVASVGQFVHVSLGSAVLLATANSASQWPIGIAHTAALSGQQILGVVPPASYTSSQSLSLSLMLYRPMLAGAFVGSTNASVSAV